MWAIPMYLFVLSANYSTASVGSLVVFALICVAVGSLFSWLWWYLFGKVTKSLIRKVEESNSGEPKVKN